MSGGPAGAGGDPGEPPVVLSIERVLEALRCAEVEVLGQLPYASNATLLCRLRHEDVELMAVYKPRRGERPLWDFPAGTLCLRECAAFLVDAALGFGMVPPTVLRDGPLGVGSMQLYVDEDPEADLEERADALAEPLRRIAAFDVIVNNADRKGGHCLIDTRGRLWAIDHGVCFNVDPKLRTVIWMFEGDPLPGDIADAVTTFRDQLGDASSPVASSLSSLLDDDEMAMLHRRSDALARSGRFPAPGSGRRHVPWPPW